MISILFFINTHPINTSFNDEYRLIREVFEKLNTNNIKKNIVLEVKATKFWDALKLYKMHYLLGILTVAVLHLLQVKIPKLTGLITDEMQSNNGTNELYKNKILLIIDDWWNDCY